MAVINGLGDNGNGAKHTVSTSATLLPAALPSDGTGGYSCAVGWIETVNLIRPTTGQLYPRGDGVP